MLLMSFRLENFTPIIDCLVEELDLVGSAVYGAVWRYCQMEHGRCFASIATLAKKIGVDRRTVERHLKRLCELDYLIDTTPDLKGAPHIYATTDKLEYVQTASFQKHSEPTTESRRGYDRKSHKETIEETIIKETNSMPPSAAAANAAELNEVEENQCDKPKNDHGSIFSALAETCAIDFNVAPKTECGKLNKVAKRLRENTTATTDDLASFKEWWFSEDWRGQKGQWPDPWDVVKEWGRFIQWKQNGYRPRSTRSSPGSSPMNRSIAAVQRVLEECRGNA